MGLQQQMEEEREQWQSSELSLHGLHEQQHTVARVQGHSLAAQVHELEVQLDELQKEQGIWEKGMGMGCG